MEHQLQSIVWIFYDRAELISHSTVWKLDIPIFTLYFKKINMVNESENFEDKIVIVLIIYSIPLDTLQFGWNEKWTYIAVLDEMGSITFH